MEAAVSDLFALFTHDHRMTVNQTADLLAVFGLGCLLMQYGVGWLAIVACAGQHSIAPSAP